MPCPNEYQMKNFGLSHCEPSDFVEPQIGGASMPYVIYRAVVAIYFCVMTVYNVLTFPSQAKWIVYMSHWSYSVITVSTLLQAIYATRHYRICKERGYDNACEKMQLPFKVIWVLQNIIYTSAPLMTILFWSLFYQGQGLNLADTNTHIANTVYWLCEICITAIPVRFLHFYHFILYGSTYILFTIIYWLAGGTGRGGEPYIYNILDYSNKPLRAATWICALVVFGSLLHFSVYTLVYLRRTVCGRCRRYNTLATWSDVCRDLT